MFLQHAFRFLRFAGAQQRIGVGHRERMVAGVDVQLPAQALRGGIGLPGGEVDVRCGDDESDLVRMVLQQRRQRRARFIELVGLGQRERQPVDVADRGAAVLLDLGAEALDREARRLVEAELDASAHQPEILAVHAPLIGVVARAVLRVGDAALRHRVRQQELRRALPRIAQRFQHAREHPRHAFGVIARIHQRQHPDAVRLAFVRAAESQLLLLDGGLGRRDCCHAGVAPRGGGDDEASQQREHVRHGVGPRLFDSAREVALAEVGQFVRDHRGHFVLVLGVEQQAVVDAHDAAGYREGVDGRILDHHELQLRVAQLAVLREVENEVFEVIREQRIRHGADLAAEHAQPRLPEPALGLGRNHRRGSVTKRGKFDVDGVRTAAVHGERDAAGGNEGAARRARAEQGQIHVRRRPVMLRPMTSRLIARAANNSPRPPPRLGAPDAGGYTSTPSHAGRSAQGSDRCTRWTHAAWPVHCRC